MRDDIATLVFENMEVNMIKILRGDLCGVYDAWCRRLMTMLSAAARAP